VRAPWTSPPDQPRWARPSLLAIAVVSGVLYGWRLGSSTEIFYAAAVRSMSMSWHNFFFAAFDPAATVSIDKLPGAFWIQALSVRLFGIHTWALALPQVVEGVLSVLVLYRVVRRCAGPVAGIIAAGLLGISPATVTLNRGNVADSLLVLLLVLAADSLLWAVRTGSVRSIVVAGVWVGLGFQAKMLEAWLVLPALVVAYLIAAGTRLSSRIVRTAGMVGIAVVISLSWIAVVSIVPHQDRPYVDGSTDDSLMSQVFDYNGFGRVGRPNPNQVLGRTLGIAFLAEPAPAASATRLFEGAPGRDTGWLLPASVIVIPVLLWTRRRHPRTDLLRASVVLWGCWLVVFAAVFSVSSINWYYLGALSPPIAALFGIAVSQAWAKRTVLTVQVIVVATVVVSVAYAVWLLPSAGTGVPGWLEGVTLALALLTTGTIIALAMTGRKAASVAGALSAVAAMVVVPAIASASVAINNLGAFDTPFQPTALTAFNKSFFGAPLRPIASLPSIERVRNGAPDLLATQTSVIAAPFIFATGQEVLPIGGYDGSTPAPTIAGLRSAIAHGEFHLVLTAPHTDDARALFLQQHCLPVHPGGPSAVVSLRVSYCLRANAT
jgi:4-amino-4-deoxy-L-arabinose transferase-like glycosyltransferase